MLRRTALKLLAAAPFLQLPAPKTKMVWLDIESTAVYNLPAAMYTDGLSEPIGRFSFMIDFEDTKGA